MFTSRTRSTRFAALALIAGGAIALTAAVPASPATVAFGGPWISIESPVNPYDASTRGALFLVHTFHHGTPSDMLLLGKAEGIVDGQRRSVDLTLAKSSRTGTYAVHRKWGDRGVWTLAIAAHPQGDQASIQVVVELGANGEVSNVQVPMKRNAAGHQEYRILSASDIDAGLRVRARGVVVAGAK